MTDLWYPAAIRNPAPQHLWGSYRDDDNQWKYLLHTTESDVFRPDDDSYYGHNNYPHFTAYLPAGEAVARAYQHIPINRAARALKNKPGGVETNADRVVQVEIVGRAHNAPNFPKALLDVVRAIGLWVAGDVGMPWQSTVPFVKVGPTTPRPTMTAAAWDNYAGICGHQHAPENDHSDPGAIDISYILNGPDPQPQPEDEMASKLWRPVGQPGQPGVGGEFVQEGHLFIALSAATKQQLANSETGGDTGKLHVQDAEPELWRDVTDGYKNVRE